MPHCIFSRQNNGFAPLKTSVKRKERLNSDAHQFHQYQQNYQLSLITKKTTTYKMYDVRNPGTGTGARGTELPPPFFNFLFTLFMFNKMSLSFHHFFLNLTCSCPHSCNQMLTATYVCRSYCPSFVIIYFQFDPWIIEDR